MDRWIAGPAMVLISVFLATCGGNGGRTPNEADTAESAMETPEEIAKLATWDSLKNDYHNLVTMTFQPAREGDLEPIRKYYKDLAAKARTWAATPVPLIYQDKELEVKVSALAGHSMAIGTLIEADSSFNDEIQRSLIGLEKRFLEIVKACND